MDGLSNESEMIACTIVFAILVYGLVDFGRTFRRIRLAEERFAEEDGTVIIHKRKRKSMNFITKWILNGFLVVALWEFLQVLPLIIQKYIL